MIGFAPIGFAPIGNTPVVGVAITPPPSNIKNLVLAGCNQSITVSTIRVTTGRLLVVSNSSSSPRSLGVIVTIPTVTSPQIIATELQLSKGVIPANKILLTGSSVLVYKIGSILLLANNTGSLATINIRGSTSNYIHPEGYGDDVNVSGGKDISILAGQSKVVKLDNILAFLSGIISLTGGVGVTAYLFQ